MAEYIIMKTGDALSNALGIENIVDIIPAAAKKLPLVVRSEQTVIDAPTENQADQDEDYRLARRTFRDLINKGNDAIEGIGDLAKESESPRAYEVMATLMKTVADTTKDLFDLQKKTKDLKGGDNNKKLDETNVTIDKAVFVGTTAELLHQLKNR
ncbi:terminase [bacterium]|nr:terminase [bacterium]